MFDEFKETWRYRAVVENFVKTTLSVRYRRSVLGYLWTVLSPLAKYSIMGIIFEIIGRFQMPNYFGFFFIGSVFFGLIQTIINNSTLALINNEHYIKKIYVPKLVFILNIVLYEFFNFFFVLLSVLILVLFMGQVVFGFAWLFVPVALIITICALVGVACVMSVVAIYFRDIQHITDILFQMLFFMTPIFYPLTLFKDNPLFATIIAANPIVYLIQLVRDPIVYNQLPPLEVILVSSVVSLGLLFGGVAVLKKFNNRIIFKL